MSKGKQLIERLCQVFPQREVTGCLAETRQEKFQVCEDGQTRRVVVVGLGQPQSGFRIHNPHEKVIYIFATDNCFFHSRDGKRCDCVIFDDTYLCFVELKVEVRTRRQATDKAADAREQLGATITFLKAAFANDFLGFRPEAYVVMREHVRPARRSQRNEAFTNFLQTYQVPLKELSNEEYKEF